MILPAVGVVPAGSLPDRQTNAQPRRCPINPRVLLQSSGLLVVSNVFMTFAWYAHLRNLSGRPWYIAAIASWGVALLEYLFQVPANRIGYTALSLRASSRSCRK